MSADSEDEGHQHRILHCGVIGAGIAGLSAAIALRKAGHEVEIFERSHFRQEVGAAIIATPNAGRILAEWGFNTAAAQGSLGTEARTIDAHTLECLKFNRLDRNGLHHRVMLYRRADMHNELKHIAKSNYGDGVPVIMSLGSEVSHVKCCTESTVFFKNRPPSKKDLIICADGMQVGMSLRRLAVLTTAESYLGECYRCPDTCRNRRQGGIPYPGTFGKHSSGSYAPRDI